MDRTFSILKSFLMTLFALALSVGGYPRYELYDSATSIVSWDLCLLTVSGCVHGAACFETEATAILRPINRSGLPEGFELRLDHD